MIGRHAIVNFLLLEEYLVDEPHHERLIADQGLVMALGVGYHVFLPPLVSERVHQVLHVPRLVGLLLEHLDPL